MHFYMTSKYPFCAHYRSASNTFTLAFTAQLRNWAGPMQAPGLFDDLANDPRGKFALVHNIGLGGAAVVSLLRRPEFWKEGGEDGRDRYVPLIPHLPVYVAIELKNSHHLCHLGWDTTMHTNADLSPSRTWKRRDPSSTRKLS